MEQDHRRKLPSLFAPFASVLQANRGGHAPVSVTDLAGRSSKPAIEVTDGAGRYRAIFIAATFPQPSQLIQQDLNSNRATAWPVDPRTNQIAGPPAQTTYHTKTITVGPDSPTTPPPMPGPTVDPNIPPNARPDTPSA